MEYFKSKKIPISYWQRYLSFIKYTSARKIINFLHSIYYWKIGKEIISTRPSFLKVEISRKCSINCLYCYSKKEDLFYPFELYKNLIDELKDDLLLVSLYDIGEPLENPDVFDFISYANKNKIGTIISTSLSIERDDRYWETITTVGLDKIIVAIDGVSDKVYNMYRLNGDLQLILSNLNKIIKYKKQHKSSLIIEWQMLDLPWNKHEQDLAKQTAFRVGCNTFRLIKEAVIPRLKYKSLNVRRTTNCLLPYIICIVNVYNKVRLCYKVYNADMVVGDLSINTFGEIWNNPQIQDIRSRTRIQNRIGCRNCIE